MGEATKPTNPQNNRFSSRTTHTHKHKLVGDQEYCSVRGYCCFIQYFHALCAQGRCGAGTAVHSNSVSHVPQGEPRAFLRLAVGFSPVSLNYWICCCSDLDSCAADPCLLLPRYLEINYWSLALLDWCVLQHPEPVPRAVSNQQELQLVLGVQIDRQSRCRKSKTKHNLYNDKTVKPLHRNTGVTDRGKKLSIFQAN